MGDQGAPRLSPGVIVVGPAGFLPGEGSRVILPFRPQRGRMRPGGGSGAPLGASWGSSSPPPARFAVTLVPWEPVLRRIFGCRRISPRGEPVLGSRTAEAVGVFPGCSLRLGVAAMPVSFRCGTLPMLPRIPVVPANGMVQVVRRRDGHRRAGPIVVQGPVVCDPGLVFAVVAMPRPVMALWQPRGDVRDPATASGRGPRPGAAVGGRRHMGIAGSCRRAGAPRETSEVWRLLPIEPEEVRGP